MPRAGLEPALCALNRTNRRHSVHISWFRLSGAGRFGGLWATPLALRPKVLKSVLGRRLVRRGRDPDGAHRALLAVEMPAQTHRGSSPARRLTRARSLAWLHRYWSSAIRPHARPSRSPARHEPSFPQTVTQKDSAMTDSAELVQPQAVFTPVAVSNDMDSYVVYLGRPSSAE